MRRIHFLPRPPKAPAISCFHANKKIFVSSIVISNNSKFDPVIASSYVQIQIQDHSPYFKTFSRSAKTFTNFVCRENSKKVVSFNLINVHEKNFWVDITQFIKYNLIKICPKFGNFPFFESFCSESTKKIKRSCLL